MAIAFDAATNTSLVTSTVITYNHTCTGTDRILFVGVFARNQLVTAVTYAGATMTEVGAREGPQGGSSDYISLYQIVNPASGTNQVSVTIAASAVLISGSVSYTGAKQSGQPDNSANNNDTAEATTTTTLTTVADNSWLMGMVRAGTDGVTNASTGTTQRVVGTGHFQMYDGNGLITPAGSASIVTTQIL